MDLLGAGNSSFFVSEKRAYKKPTVADAIADWVMTQNARALKSYLTVPGRILTHQLFLRSHGFFCGLKYR